MPENGVLLICLIVKEVMPRILKLQVSSVYSKFSTLSSGRIDLKFLKSIKKSYNCLIVAFVGSALLMIVNCAKKLTG
jgi:hypothetical protein